jgi:hypothetical protein
VTDVEDLRVHLDDIAEALADRALDVLRTASSEAGRGGMPDPALLAQEKRLTRARRAVEKAARLLDDPDRTGSDDGFVADGP